MDALNPEDAAILQDLQKQLQIGKEGFSMYYHGNLQGIDQIKQAYSDSQADIQSINNFRVHREAESLLQKMNTAIRHYMRQPSQENLSELKSVSENYEQFLSNQ